MWFKAIKLLTLNLVCIFHGTCNSLLRFKHTISRSTGISNGTGSNMTYLKQNKNKIITKPNIFTISYNNNNVTISKNLYFINIILHCIIYKTVQWGNDICRIVKWNMNKNINNKICSHRTSSLFTVSLYFTPQVANI